MGQSMTPPPLQNDFILQTDSFPDPRPTVPWAQGMEDMPGLSNTELSLTKPDLAMPTAECLVRHRRTNRSPQPVVPVDYIGLPPS